MYAVGTEVQVDLGLGEVVDAVVEGIETRSKVGKDTASSYNYTFYHLKVLGDKYPYKKLATEAGRIIGRNKAHKIVDKVADY
jgi:hypothetical protein